MDRNAARNTASRRTINGRNRGCSRLNREYELATWEFPVASLAELAGALTESKFRASQFQCCVGFEKPGFARDGWKGVMFAIENAAVWRRSMMAKLEELRMRNRKP
jgi:hypothetical protein